MKNLLLSIALPLFFFGCLNAEDAPPQDNTDDVIETPVISLKPIYDFLTHNVECAEHLMSLTHGKKSQEHIWWFYYGQLVTAKNLRTAVQFFEENKDMIPPKLEKKSKKFVQDDFSINLENPSFN